jgi:hypothetical protein
VDADADMNLDLPGGSSPESVEAMRLMGTWSSSPFARAMSGIDCCFDYLFYLVVVPVPAFGPWSICILSNCRMGIHD